MPGIDHVMREDASAAEETGQDHVAPAGVAGASGQQIVRHNAEHRPQFENVPPVLPQDGHRRPLARHGIAFTRDRLDKCGLAAAVRSQNGHMFVAADHQAEIFQDNLLSAHHRDILQIQKSRLVPVHGVLSLDDGGCTLHGPRRGGCPHPPGGAELRRSVASRENRSSFARLDSRGRLSPRSL